MKILRFILPVLILAGGAAGFQYLKSTKEPVEKKTRTVRPPVVATLTVKKQSVSPTLTLFGRVETPKLAALTAGIEADVLEVLVLEGNQVDKDQLLVSLDTSDIKLDRLQRRAEVAEIEAQLDSDRKRFSADKQALENEKALLSISAQEVARARKLAKSSAGTQATLDTALKDEQRQKLAIAQRQQSINDFSSRQKLWKARLDKANAALQRVERDQQRSEVRAPFAGRIVEVMVSPGDRSARGSTLVKLYDQDSLEIRSQIPGEYVQRLRDAQDAGTAVEAITQPGQLRLILNRLSASIAEGQGGVDAFFRSQQPLPELGRTLSLNLSLPMVNDAVLVNTDSLYDSNQVFVVTDNRLQSRRVKQLGQMQDEDGRRILLDGGDFKAGELILQSRLPQAIDGLSVEIAQ